MSTGLRFTLEVDGLPPDAFAVVSFHLTQSLSSLFSSISPWSASSFSPLNLRRCWTKWPT